MARSRSSPPQGPEDPKTIRALVARYLRWLPVANYSPQTIRSKKYLLARFVAWCEERSIQQPTEVTRQILERYQRTVFQYRQENGKPLTRAAQNGYLGAVTVFFSWLSKRGLLLYNPGADLERPRQEQALPRHVLAAREVEKVLQAIDVTQPLGLRDRTMLETLYSTGIRRAELRKLKIFDLDAERGTMLVRLGKSKKDRVVPIGERALAWIHKYVEESRPLYVQDEDDGTLFLSSWGAALSDFQLSRIARQRLDDAGLWRPGSGCHVFRHTAATLMLENGADIRYIQQMLGHAHLSTTQVYTAVSITKLKEVHTRTHPGLLRRRAKDKTDAE